MPQEPKKRHSRQRQGKRRASIRLELLFAVPCANCGTPVVPHTVCRNCGYYKGKEVIAKSKKQKSKEKPETQAVSQTTV